MYFSHQKWGEVRHRIGTDGGILGSSVAWDTRGVETQEIIDRIRCLWKLLQYRISLPLFALLFYRFRLWQNGEQERKRDKQKRVARDFGDWFLCTAFCCFAVNYEFITRCYECIICWTRWSNPFTISTSVEFQSVAFWNSIPSFQPYAYVRFNPLYRNVAAEFGRKSGVLHSLFSMPMLDAYASWSNRWEIDVNIACCVQLHAAE